MYSRTGRYEGGWWLQVKNQAGQWINAPPIPGTLVCNLGDMLKVTLDPLLAANKTGNLPAFDWISMQNCCCCSSHHDTTLVANPVQGLTIVQLFVVLSEVAEFVAGVHKWAVHSDCTQGD